MRGSKFRRMVGCVGRRSDRKDKACWSSFSSLISSRPARPSTVRRIPLLRLDLDNRPFGPLSPSPSHMLYFATCGCCSGQSRDWPRHTNTACCPLACSSVAEETALSNWLPHRLPRLPVECYNRYWVAGSLYKAGHRTPGSRQSL